MARKSSKVSEFMALVEVQHDVALDVYQEQDEATRNVIHSTAALIQKQMTGELKGGHAIPLSTQHEFGIVLAVEVMKDLALTGIQIASFKLPDKMCASCGDAL